jgi:hypothetical protein
MSRLDYKNTIAVAVHDNKTKIEYYAKKLMNDKSDRDAHVNFSYCHDKLRHYCITCYNDNSMISCIKEILGEELYKAVMHGGDIYSYFNIRESINTLHNNKPVQVGTRGLGDNSQESKHDSSTRPQNYLFLYVIAFVFISSTIYMVENYLFYYYGKEKFVQEEFKQYESMIANLLSQGASSQTIKDTIEIASFKININESNTGALISNNKYVDEKRSPVTKRSTLTAKGNEYTIDFTAGIRPNPLVHLYRAWTFSLSDLIRSPSVWFNKELYMRTVPLVFAWIVTLVLLLMHKYLRESALKKKEVEFANKKMEVEMRLNGNINELQSELHSISIKIREAESEKSKIKREKDNVSTELLNVASERDSAKRNAKLLEKSEQDLKNQIENAKARADNEIDELQKRYSEIVFERDEIKRLLLDVADTTNSSDLDNRIFKDGGNILSLGDFVVNDFEKKVFDALNDYIKKNNKGWKLYHDYDVGRSHTGPMCTDIILITDKVAFVFELKSYSGKIISQGDYKNESWYLVRSGGYKKAINSCHGNNPYKQVKTYTDAYRNKLQRAGADDVDTIGAVVFNSNADVSKLGDNHNNGLVTINKFFYIMSFNRLIDFIETKNYGADKIIPCYEELPKAM